MDEKTQVQALDRTQPLLPVSFGKAEKRTHDYVRHGGVNLFGALNTQTGKVTGACYPRHRSEEFLHFMNQVAAEHKGRNLHVIVDNFSTHKGDDVREWLGRNPNVTFHYTPVGSSQGDPQSGLTSSRAIWPAGGLLGGPVACAGI